MDTVHGKSKGCLVCISSDHFSMGFCLGMLIDTAVGHHIGILDNSGLDFTLSRWSTWLPFLWKSLSHPRFLSWQSSYLQLVSDYRHSAEPLWTFQSRCYFSCRFNSGIRSVHQKGQSQAYNTRESIIIHIFWCLPLMLTIISPFISPYL